MPPNNLLVDSSFLVALYDRDADEHAAVKVVAELYRGNFLVPQVVLTEVSYLLQREMGVRGVMEFLEDLIESQPGLQEITLEDLERVKDIMQQYESSRFDLVDCCIMALAERLNIVTVCTLDLRDFVVFRPKHCDYLEILP